MADQTPDLTQLLNRAAGGDPDAAREAFPAIYEELRRLASSRARHAPGGGTFQTTALVHEAYLRVAGRHPEGWQGMRHFYFTAARAMRDILVEDARRKGSLKRGGDRERVPLDEITRSFDTEPGDVLGLDAALRKLEQQDPDGHQFVLLRFFTGLSIPEIAPLVGSSVRTLERKWRFLRAWFARELDAAEAGS